MNTYDPNLRWSNQTVEIIYQMWEYVATHRVVIRGNCKGMSVINTAIDRHAEELQRSSSKAPVLYMTAADGRVMENACDEEETEDWLSSMCIGLRIVSVDPYDGKFGPAR